MGCGEKLSTRAQTTDPLHPGMVWVAPGQYSLGAGAIYPEEGPRRLASSPGFWIGAREVTAAEFAKFVQATGYVTLAERGPDPRQYPNVPKSELRPSSAVWKAEQGWSLKPGVNWRMNKDPRLPVVHVAFEDAMAYAKWRRADLPTADEWEIAARGGLRDRKYAWGDSLLDGAKYRANTHQGEFPDHDSGADGFAGLAPVGSFPPNGYGLFDVAGNAWELTKTPGPPDEASGQATVVAKGGSFLCSPNSCARYRPAAWVPITLDSTSEHVGFRVIVRLEAEKSR